MAGGIAGSLVLNQRFEDCLKNLLGDEIFIDLKKKPGFTHTIEYFDRHVKTAFSGGEEEEYPVKFSRAKIPDEAENGIESNCWMMKG